MLQGDGGGDVMYHDSTNKSLSQDKFLDELVVNDAGSVPGSMWNHILHETIRL